MTLAVAWVRHVAGVAELVFASDSRLTGGQRWDGCPKIVALPRSDCLIAFAGDTNYAYPLMLQMANGIQFHRASSDRRTDLAEAKGIALKVFNAMRAEISDFPMGRNSAGDPEVGFLFGGFSWRDQQFRIWQLHYDESIDLFTFRPTTAWRGQLGRPRIVAWIGDAVPEAKSRLVTLLRARGRLTSGGLDMEPFEVLRDIIRDGHHPSIGGAPQLAKVYRSLRSQHFAVHWPDAEGPMHALGRRQLDFEVFDLPTIDPDKPAIHSRTARVAASVITPDANAVLLDSPADPE